MTYSFYDWAIVCADNDDMIEYIELEILIENNIDIRSSNYLLNNTYLIKFRTDKTTITENSKLLEVLRNVFKDYNSEYEITIHKYIENENEFYHEVCG